MTFSSVPSNPASPNPRNSMSLDVAAALIENRRALLQFLAHHVGSRDMAEEVLQRFYLRAMRKASTIQKAGSIPQWLFRVLNSTLLLIRAVKPAGGAGGSEKGNRIS